MGNFYNILLEKLVLPLGDACLRAGFMKYLNECRKIATWGEKEINDLQAKKLERLLIHASHKSPYYKSLSITPDSDPFLWLKKFPVLEKAAVRQKQNELLSVVKDPLIKVQSSGSTGFQTTVYLSRAEQSMTRAIQTLWWEWAGFKIGDPILQTGMTPHRGFVKGVKDTLLNTYYLPAFCPTREEYFRALSWAKKQKKPVLAGYASSLYVLAQRAQEYGIDIKFKTAISWGDKLFDHYKAKIHDVFKTETYETYGSAEGLMMAGQYDQPWMYLSTPDVYLELLDESGREVEEGQMGHVIVTNLNGYAMPLIRYRLGDLAIKLPKGQYPADRKLSFPFLQKVIGRDTDLVRTRSGKYLVVHSFTGVFEHFPQIKQFCVLQENLDGIAIQYIPGVGFKSDCLELVREKIQGYIQEPFEIAFEEVSLIPPTKSGKPQIIISKL
jgi:phenylacetate-CoA ligase